MPSHPHYTFTLRLIGITFLVFSLLLMLFWMGRTTSAESSQQITTASVINTITVNSLSDAANGNDGLCTLREAITAANTNTASGAVAGECAAGSSSSSDTISLTGLAGTINVQTVLPNITSDMNINGPGSAVLTILRGGSNFIMFFITATAHASISGVTVQGADPTSNFGINSAGNLSLSDCVVSGFGRGIGSAATSSQFVITISNCTITGNLNGGGISTGEATVNVINSVISGNGSNGAFGPAIDNSFGILNVTNTTIANNTGHIAVMNGVEGVATFTNTNIGNNPDGGFINNGNLTMTGGSVSENNRVGLLAVGPSFINRVTVSHNTNTSGAFINGGGILIGGNPTTVMNCLISDNFTNGNGGGIFNAGKATLINNTITGNTAVGSGGGIYTVDNSSASFIAINLTVTNNRSNSGGGVFRESGQMKFKNSIIAGNFDFNGIVPNDIGASVDSTSSFNLIGVGGSGGLTNGVNSNQVGVADPRLGPLANNGGPTFTHSLLPNSPALDAADNCITQASHCGDPSIPQIISDQRGFNRIVDGPDVDTNANVDVGAFETQQALNLLSGTFSNEDTQLVITFDAGDTSTITSITASSDNVTLIPNDSAHLSAVLAGTTGVVTVNPAANLFGTANVTVTVNRSGGNDVKTLLVTINPSNDAPTFNKGSDQLQLEDAGPKSVANWATSLSAGPPNEAGQSLHFQIINNTNPAMFSAGPAIDSAGNLSYTPAADANGTANLTVVLIDDGGIANGGSDTSLAQTFTINITPVNDAPTFAKGPDQTVNEDSGSSIVFGWATVTPGGLNESGQNITSVIMMNTNPGLFSAAPTVNGSGVLSFATAFNANGVATVTMRLKDNGGTANGGSDTSQEQTFTITINAVNDAPTFSKGPNQTVNNDAGPQTVTNWATNILPGPSADELNQTVNFQIVSNNNPGLFSVAPTVSPSGTLTYQPATNGGGSATITLNLKDNGGTANNGRDISFNQSFAITVVPAGGSLRFSAANSQTTESSGSTSVTVVRTGDLSRAVTVDYATSADPGSPCGTTTGTASPKCDFTAAAGTLQFSAGESTKTITVLLNQDSFVEGPEIFNISLSNQTGGSALSVPFTATVTIIDDATEPPENPIDDAGTFVRQHYHDFLNREPDQSGLDFWTSEITACGSNTSCIEVKRINVSAAFFLSTEFQQTGYLVERLYKTAYGDTSGLSTLNGPHQLSVPIIRSDEFLPDTQKLSQGVIVNVGNWQQQLEMNKQAFVAEFVQRARFTTAYPSSMSAAEFVDKLNLNAGNPLSQTERNQLVNDLASSAKTRGEVLRSVAEDPDLFASESNRAFVLMQYLGYMRRNPNDPQDSDYTGYEFWLTKLNQFNGNFFNAEMVKAFISSSEYRHRSGQ